MYGGKGRRRLSALALTVAVLGAGTACEEEVADPGRARESVAPSTDDLGSIEAQAAAYEAWEPVYGEVRPATAEDVDSLRQRVVDLNESTYTAALPLMGFEIASTPDHVRVRFGEDAPGGFDLHLDPDASSESFFGPFVMCSADDGSCVEVGEDGPQGGGGPHMFNNGMDTVIFWASGIVSTQNELPDLLPASPEDVSVTTVESPAGTLDCLLTGSTPEQRTRLEGTPVDEEADPVVRDGDPDPLSTLCVDERGLVVVALPSLATGVVPYGSVEPGVPDGFDEHPDPVPYGATPSPESESPEPSATTSSAMVHVLIASEPIQAGTSLEEVQQTGRLDLHFVPREDLVAGAVSSAEEIDGVATRDIAEGEQITADSFG